MDYTIQYYDTNSVAFGSLESTRTGRTWVTLNEREKQLLQTVGEAPIADISRKRTQTTVLAISFFKKACRTDTKAVIYLK